MVYDFEYSWIFEFNKKIKPNSTKTFTFYFVNTYFENDDN